MNTGYCPINGCGQPTKWREKRPNGNDTCSAGHQYPSAAALSSVDGVSTVYFVIFDGKHGRTTQDGRAEADVNAKLEEWVANPARHQTDIIGTAALLNSYKSAVKSGKIPPTLIRFMYDGDWDGKTGISNTQ